MHLTSPTASFRPCCCRSTTTSPIDEASFRKHLRDVAAVEGISAITINAHSTEVASCSFDEQRRVLEIAQDEIGGRLPLVNGIWADGSLEAARIARMAARRRRLGAAGVSAGAVHARAERRQWRWRISSASPTRPTCR